MNKKVLIIFGLVFAFAIGGSFWVYSNGYYHALRGGYAQANKDLDKALFYFKVAYDKNPEAFMIANDIAGCYALKGENASCFHWLRIALKTRHGDYVKKEAKTERDFDSVRQTAEFQLLVYDLTVVTSELQ